MENKKAFDNFKEKHIVKGAVSTTPTERDCKLETINCCTLYPMTLIILYVI